jgi:hypothetical protein
MTCSRYCSRQALPRGDRRGCRAGPLAVLRGPLARAATEALDGRASSGVRVVHD